MRILVHNPTHVSTVAPIYLVFDGGCDARSENVPRSRVWMRVDCRWTLFLCCFWFAFALHCFFVYMMRD